MTLEPAIWELYTVLVITLLYSHIWILCALSVTKKRMSHCCSYILTQHCSRFSYIHTRDARTMFGVLLQKEACHVWERWEGGKCWGPFPQHFPPSHERGGRGRGSNHGRQQLWSHYLGKATSRALESHRADKPEYRRIFTASLTQTKDTALRLPEWIIQIGVWQKVKHGSA